MNPFEHLIPKSADEQPVKDERPGNLRIRPGVFGLEQLDPAIWEAVQQGARYWPGTVEVTSAGRHKGDRGNHSGGHAVDVRLYDESGKPLSNIRDGGRHARDYEKFWQAGVAMAAEKYPDLTQRARWGGNFLNSVGADYMHLDVTPGRATAGGNLASGATRDMLRKWGGQSEGITGGDWAAHREFLRTGKNPDSLGAQLARAGAAVLDAVIPAAQADEAVSAGNPFAGLMPSGGQAEPVETAGNPFAHLIPEGGQAAVPVGSDNPFAHLIPQGGDTGAGTSIQGSGLPTLQAPGPNVQPPAGPVLPGSPVPPGPLPPTPNQRARQALQSVGPLGQALATAIPPDAVEQEQAMQAVGDERLPEAVIQDFRRGAAGFSPDEFERMQAALERGDIEDPQAARDLFVGRVPMPALGSLDEAIATAKQRKAMEQQSAVTEALPGGRALLGLIGKAADEATLGVARPELPMAGGRDVQKLLKAANRAQTLEQQKTLEDNPIGSLVTSIAGGVVPYALGLRGLRNLRAARGLPEVGPGVLGQVAEGAKLGGPIEFLRKPEERAPSAVDEFQQRVLQAGAGVALGALLDAGIGGTGEALGLVKQAMRDKKTRVALEREAQAAGFTDPQEYMASLFDVIQTPEGPVARPSRAIFNDRAESGGTISSSSSPEAVGPVSLTPEENLKRVAQEREARWARWDKPKEVAEADSVQPPAEAAGPVSPTPLLPGPKVEAAAAVEAVAPTPGAAPKVDSVESLRAEAEALERSADELANPTARRVLKAEAALKRQAADALERGQAPKKSREDVLKERARERVTVDPERDDLITAIRKLGGIDVDLESDWQGRLSHLNKRAIGLAGVERTGGKGRSLDDLAEALQERGYLQSRDKTELEARLSQAESGAPQWSYAKQNYEGPERSPVSGGTGPAVTRTDGVAAFRELPEDQNWVIDPESGSVYPSSLIDEDELTDIEIGIKRDDVRQQREDEWFRREQAGTDGDAVPAREQSTPVQDARGDGVPERVESAVQGRAGDQSGPTEAGELFGGLSDAEKATADKLALEELQKEKARQRNANNSPPADEGLFGLDNRQADILDEPGISIIDQASEIFARPLGTPITESDRVILQKGIETNIREAISDLEAGQTFEKSGITFMRDGDLSKAMRNGLPLASFKLRVEARTRSTLLETMKSNLPGAAGGTLYSNPIGAVAKNLLDDAKEAPVAAALAVLTGGTFAGLKTKEEPGTAKWWRDVLLGGVVLHGGLAALRRVSVTGKGGYFEKLLFDKVGGWVSGIPLIGQGPVELRGIKREQQGKLAQMNRQTENIGNFLLKHFTPSERAAMSDMIEGRGIAPELGRVHQQAKELDDYLTFVGQQLKDLGMLPEDVELGGYIHRYYAKHLGMSKLFREAKGQSISGTWSLGRGTHGEFQREYLSPGARAVVEEYERIVDEIEGIDKEIKKLGKQQAKAERTGQMALDPEEYLDAVEALNRNRDELDYQLKELRKREFKEFIGDENGKAKAFIFTPDEVGRVDAGVGPVKIHAFKPKPGEQAMGPAMPVKELPELYPSDRVWSLNGTQGEKVVLHRDWTKAERTAWGENRDAGYRYVRGMSEATNDLSLGLMFQKIARNGDWVSDTDPGGWVKVPDAKVGKGSSLRKYGALSGKYVKPDVWNGIQRYGRSVLGNSTAARIYKDALSRWKVWHTADNPLSHFNNSHSNVQMLLLSGRSPLVLVDAIKAMHAGEKSPVWRDMAEDGLFGNDQTSALLTADGSAARGLLELAEALRTQPEIPDATLLTSKIMDLKAWWHESGQHLREAKGAKGTGKALIKGLAGPAKVVGSAVQAPYAAYSKVMRKAYRFEDNLFKAAVYIDARKKGMSRLEAVEEAERYFFDYYDVPDIIRFARDLPVGSPFISYTYLAGKTMVRTAVEHPERILALVAGYEALNAAAMRTHQDGDRPGRYWELSEAVETLSAPWDRGRTMAGVRNTTFLPGPDAYRIALGNAHALGGLFLSEAGGREMLPEMPLLGQVWGSSIFGGSPLHALLDIGMNEDWKGKRIYNKHDSLEERTKKSLAYLYRAWAPSTPLLPGSYHNSKIMEGLANDVAEAKRDGKNSLATPIVMSANSIAEALGFQQFTGRDRLDNPITTQEAMLGSIGIKLRPPGFDQTLDMELGKLQKERQELRDEFRRQSRDAMEQRYTNAQLKKFEDAYYKKLEDVQAREDKLFDAQTTLKKAGIPLKPVKKVR